jgi:hypothetical protein
MRLGPQKAPKPLKRPHRAGKTCARRPRRILSASAVRKSFGEEQAAVAEAPGVDAVADPE